MKVSEVGSSPSEQLSSENSGPQVRESRRFRLPRWSVISPFFMSAVLYLSAFLAVLAPLPLLLIGMRRGRKWLWAASLSNALLVLGMSDLVRLSFYLSFVVMMSLALTELLIRRKSLEKAVAVTWIIMHLSIAGLFLTYCQVRHLNPVREYQSQLSTLVEGMSKTLGSRPDVMNSAELEDWKQDFRVEFPSALSIFTLLLVWSNLILLLRANPNGLRHDLGLESDFFKKWKAPEFMVWPTLASGFLILFNLGLVSDIGLNVFKVLMTIYLIQGLSILSYVFDLIGVRGFLRTLAYLLSLMMMMPLILVLGFFDLWFDFRGKFRQS